jgi:hypothetical protein
LERILPYSRTGLADTRIDRGLAMLPPLQFQIPIEIDTTVAALIALVGTCISVLVWTIKNVLAQTDKFRITLENHLTTLSDNQARIADILGKIQADQLRFFERWEERWTSGQMPRK